MQKLTNPPSPSRQIVVVQVAVNGRLILRSIVTSGEPAVGVTTTFSTTSHREARYSSNAGDISQTANTPSAMPMTG